MREFILYSNLETKETIFECWGASTKHPDARFHYSDFKKSDFMDNHENVYAWLLECASKMMFFFNTRKIVKFADKIYENYLTK